MGDPNIHYISKHNNPCSAWTDPVQNSEAMFNEFFCTDYPQFRPKTKMSKITKCRNYKTKKNNDSNKIYNYAVIHNRDRPIKKEFDAEIKLLPKTICTEKNKTECKG